MFLVIVLNSDLKPAEMEKEGKDYKIDHLGSFTGTWTHPTKTSKIFFCLPNAYDKNVSFKTAWFFFLSNKYSWVEAR